MAKPPGSSEKKDEGQAKPAGQPAGGEAKKSHDAPASRVSKGKGHDPAPGGCFSWGCKASADRFNFCDEHYDHFKFGLIKKTGEPVSDYEKKFEHFRAYKAKRSAHKVA